MTRTKIIGKAKEIDGTIFPNEVLEIANKALLTFLRLTVGSKSYLVFLLRPPIKETQTVVVKMQSVRLGILNVYELRSGQDGILVGYLFHTPSSDVKLAHNFILVKKGSFNQIYTIRDVIKGGTNLKLCYSFPKIRIYSYGSDAMLILSALNNNIVEQLNRS